MLVFSRFMEGSKKSGSTRSVIGKELRGGFIKEGIDFLRNTGNGVKRILFSQLLLNCVTSMLFVFIPLYLIELNHAEIGYVFFIYSAIFGVSSIFWGRLSDRFGKPLFPIAGFVFSGVLVIFFLNLSTFISALILTAILGLAFSSLEPVLDGLLNDRISTKKLGIANGISVSSVAIGMSAGPIVGGYVISVFGFPNLFILSTVICFIGSAICITIRHD